MYLYVLCVSIIWLALTVAGDVWWPATLILFGPRWLLLLPLVFLLPMVIIGNRRLILPLIVLLVIVMGPVMGLTISPTNAPYSKGTLSVITCNLQNGEFKVYVSTR